MNQPLPENTILDEVSCILEVAEVYVSWYERDYGPNHVRYIDPIYILLRLGIVPRVISLACTGLSPRVDARCQSLRLSRNL